MITDGPEFDKFVVEPGMEIEPFDPKLIKEIFLNHPYKILLFHLNKHPPEFSRWVNEDINDFYFKMLDDYNRYGICFSRKYQLFPDNNLYVIENKDKNIKYNLNIYSSKKLSKNKNKNKDNRIKYMLLFNNHYDKKTLLFNKVKKIDLNECDSGKKPLSEWEKEKRDTIREQKNKYIQVAMMDPDVYNNDKLFKDLIMYSDDYYFYLDRKYPFIYMDDNYEEEEYFKEQFQKQIDMVKKLDYRINEDTNDYITKID